MIEEIRAHIKSSVKRCSTKYQEIDNPFFNEEDLVGSKINYQYSTVFGDSLSIIGDDLGNVANIPVNMKIYRQGLHKKLDEFDNGYEDALIIKDLILDRSLLNSKEYIKGMTSSTVIPGEVLNSQDIYSYEINFIFTISYGLGD